MSYLLIGDLHLTDNARDAYRFGIFKWIKDQQYKYEVNATFILGDLTNSKDYHSSALVNRITKEIANLKKPVYILKGNHDYVDPTKPFFAFMNYIQGIRFVVNPDMVCHNHAPVIMLPHCRDEAEFEAGIRAFTKIDPKPALLLTHQTFTGAIAETGASLTGFSQAPIELLNLPLGVYAGDVHRPQRAALVTYVGAPYNIRFGDDFVPRCILLPPSGKPKDLYFDTLAKWTLTISNSKQLLDNQRLRKGDQVKLTVELGAEDVVDWQAHKERVLKTAAKLGLEVFGINLKINTNEKRTAILKNRVTAVPASVLKAFCKHENISNNISEVGQELLTWTGGK